MASTGLLVCTNDTQLAAWLTDPRSGVEREYAVTVRGRMSDAGAARFVDGITIGGHRHRAAAAAIRKASNRETHLLVTLTEGRNREIRRLCESRRSRGDPRAPHPHRRPGAGRSGPRRDGGLSPRK